MENLTHTFVGAALAECGLKRVTPLATTTLLIAANVPDIDVVSGFFGSAAYLEWHRGITHSLVGFPVVAALLAVAVHFISGRRSSLPRLLGVSLIGTATHPLLDFTNAYGWRPFLPWDGTWHFTDIAFVVDPWIWLGLGAALCLSKSETPTRKAFWLVLAALTSLVVFAAGLGWVPKVVWSVGLAVIVTLRLTMTVDEKHRQFINRIAIAGLVLYLVSLSILHSAAIFQAAEVAQRGIAANEQVVQLNAMPTEANPFRWRLVIETERAFHTGDLDVIGGDPVLTRTEREQVPAELVEQARASDVGRRFLRFARFPIFRLVEGEGSRAVEIKDIRFAGVTNGFRVQIALDSDK
jgi:inner membrane protein